MSDADNIERLGTLVKARTLSLQRTSTGLVRRAIQDIERLTTDALVAQLVDQMCNDADWEEREAAWLKLRKMGTTYRGWGESLRSAIYGGDGWSRIFAAESLSRFKCNPQDAIPVLIATIDSCAETGGDEKTRFGWGRLACGALNNYDLIPDDFAAELVTVLIKVLDATPFADYSSLAVDQYHLRALALGMLGNLGSKAEVALPKLAPLLEFKGNPPVGDPLHSQYLDAAERIALGARTPLDAFGAALRSKNPLARREAVCGLYVLGQSASPLLPDLLRLVRDEDFNVRRFLAMTVGKLGIRTTETLGALHQLVEDSESSVSLGAHYGLCVLGDQARDNLHALLRMLGSSESFVRFLASWAVGEVGKIDRQNALAALTAALRNETNPRNKEMTRQAIEKLR
jgi:hypothetical protein